MRTKRLAVKEARFRRGATQLIVSPATTRFQKLRPPRSQPTDSSVRVTSVTSTRTVTCLSPVALPNTVLLSERLHEAFLDSGLPPDVAAHAAWQLSFLTLASAIEEQGDPADWKDEFLRSSPAIAAGGRLAEALRSSANIDHHERFEFGLDVLLAGIVHVH